MTSAAVTIPSTEGLLAGTYTTNTTYNVDGSVNTVALPAIGGVATGAQPAETLTYGYNSLGMGTTLSGTDTYVTDTAYDSLGRLSATLYNNGGSKHLAQIYAYEEGTGRLLEHGVYDNDTSEVYRTRTTTTTSRATSPRSRTSPTSTVPAPTTTSASATTTSGG